MDMNKAKMAVIEQIKPACADSAERHYVQARRELGLDMARPSVRHNNRPAM